MFNIIDDFCSHAVSLIVPLVGMRLLFDYFRICIFGKDI